MTPTIKRGVKAAVIDDQGRVLRIKREGFRFWVMPGGALEPGETPEASAIRETEESSYRIAIDRLVGRYVLPGGPLGRHETLCFLGHVVGGQAIERGPETLAVAWFTPDNLPRRCTLHQRQMVADALANYPQPVQRFLQIPAWQLWARRVAIALRDTRNRWRGVLRALRGVG